MDLKFSSPTFAATEVSVAAVTEAGKAFLASMFGAGAVSITLPKSRGEDFAVFAARKGIKIG